MGEPGRLRLHLLGRFAAEVDGEPPRNVEMSGKLRRALLAYLAMQPSLAETRERLASLLWGESPDRQARQNLRQCLLDLRRDFEAVGLDPLKVDRTTIALDPGLIAVDAREFLTVCDSDGLVDLEKAIGLYDGPLLDGLDLDIEAFRDWLGKERARLEQAAVLAIQKYARRQDEAGNASQAIRAAERLVRLDPLRESAQRLLIGVLARHSGRSVALAQAATLTSMLRAELDADPEPETAALIKEIKSRPTEQPSAVRVRNDTVEVAPTDEVALPEADRTAASAATPAIPPPRRMSIFVERRWWAAGGAATLSAAALLALFVYYRAPTPQANEDRAATTAAPEQLAADPSWRSPGIMPGIVANNGALANTGVYSVVVLPFNAETVDRKEEKFLADRVTDDLINDLSRVPALRVIARQTSRLYAGRSVDVAAVGAELGVHYVVEGRIQLQDERIRINVALIDPTTRLQVWSDRFERDQTERFAAQDEIARSIARHLHLSVMDAEDRRRSSPGAGDPTVEDLLAKGWNGMVRIFELGTTSGADKSFEEVLRRQPANGSAMLGLAGYKIGVVAMFAVAEREPHLTEADALLTRILKNNPRSSMANYYNGLLHKMRGKPDEAIVAFRTVLEINPSFPQAYANIGHVLSRMGRPDEAMEHLRYAIKLSPKDPSIGIWSLYAGELELERGRDETALEWLRRAVEVNPRSVFNHAALAAVLALRGEKAVAAKHAAMARDMAPWLTLDSMVERLANLSTKGAEPRRLIEGLRKAVGDAG